MAGTKGPPSPVDPSAPPPSVPPPEEDVEDPLEDDDDPLLDPLDPLDPLLLPVEPLLLVDPLPLPLDPLLLVDPLLPPEPLLELELRPPLLEPLLPLELPPSVSSPLDDPPASALSPPFEPPHADAVHAASARQMRKGAVVERSALSLDMPVVRRVPRDLPKRRKRVEQFRIDSAALLKSPVAGRARDSRARFFA
jgi:hypothetical protein